MEPMTFVYSFTIEGYDVTVTIEFFSHIIVLRDSSLKSTDDEFEDVDTFLNLWISNGWMFILLCFILLLEYFIVGILYYWNILLPVGLSSDWTSLTKPILTDQTVPSFRPTERADASERNLMTFSTPVRWHSWSWFSKPTHKPYQPIHI